MYVCSIFP
jgi:hypothetical protein